MPADARSAGGGLRRLAFFVAPRGRGTPPRARGHAFSRRRKTRRAASSITVQMQLLSLPRAYRRVPARRERTRARKTDGIFVRRLRARAARRRTGIQLTYGWTTGNAAKVRFTRWARDSGTDPFSIVRRIQRVLLSLSSRHTAITSSRLLFFVPTASSLLSYSIFYLEVLRKTSNVASDELVVRRPSRAPRETLSTLSAVMRGTSPVNKFHEDEGGTCDRDAHERTVIEFAV